MNVILCRKNSHVCGGSFYQSFTCVLWLEIKTSNVSCLIFCTENNFQIVSKRVVGKTPGNGFHTVSSQRNTVCDVS